MGEDLQLPDPGSLHFIELGVVHGNGRLRRDLPEYIAVQAREVSSRMRIVQSDDAREIVTV